MIPFLLHEIAPIINANIIGVNPIIKEVTIDSRNISDHCMFIALHGKRFDSHNFAKHAVLSGASAILVSRQLPIHIPQLIVNDTRLALGTLAAWVRKQVPTKVIALTGSSGKTSVKNMTTSILRQCGQVVATKENENNDIGVSLTLLKLTYKDDFAVIELGANCIGDISWTTSLVRPNTALVNNISVAHLSGFGSLANVAQEKGEIFKGLLDNGVIIFNANSNNWANWKLGLSSNRVWSFSLNKIFNKKNNFFATKIITNFNKLNTIFTLHSPQGNCRLQLPLVGLHNVNNALAASALSLSVGATLSEIKTGLANTKAIPGRLFPIRLGVGKLLLDDSYNANVSSMLAAAHVLAKMPGYKIMVVGDMAELGSREIEYHRQVGISISMVVGINKILSFGNMSKMISSASKLGEHFTDKAQLLDRLNEFIDKYKLITILVKGSRYFAMDKVVRNLQEQTKC
ncbi:UDP-N-acetylmuramoyl-tripeptide--D-alanyl-D-alanine ligase [Candidatus Palibaumannia cicadellinicola]|uniref:UDP-N-acetylmuramoyl-tripeptide--D-alanyl-D-alanine ligase n=1 Tax=Candidatus Palibaumannia cicadellinicola TaxID=186490 RepID=A0A0K2BLZ1_9GAMM|nr:UDP-N-acetylmuramoyl-tripeptide--D-alanyl-D-alanine ligase [Candidatus Baumannia cicadellinicola]AKZ66053.1 UDP-N-acetylmuramoylalanyl-D-glutamyl-2,6- diaminopimelate--D-alanyl-D-alanine ligase [Candidatus Baumannia cicadellinicola]